MRVLLISQWFPPEPTRLILELAESLQELGHVVEVLTGFPNYPAGRIYDGYRQSPWQRETISGLSVTRVVLYPDHSRSAIKRVLNYLSFAFSASLLAPFLMRRPDVVFVYGSPYTTAIPARVLQLLWGAPFIFNVQDLWPDSLGATGMLGQRALRLIQYFADWVYRKATAIVTISHGFAERIKTRNVRGSKVHVISNWADVEMFRPTGVDQSYRQEMGLDERLVVMYAGSIGPPQGLHAVVDAAALLRDDPRVRFVLVGDGIDLPRLQAQVSTLGLDNVRFLGRFAEESMPRVYSLADVLLVHLSPDPNLSMTIPHKLFVCMATGKPVLGAVGPDASMVIEEAECGVVCRPGDAESIAGAVRKLLDLPPRALAEMGANGRRAVSEVFSRRHLVEKISDVLQQVKNQESSVERR